MSTHDDLHTTLRDTFDLYRKTHLAHWNVRGPHFPALHAMFDVQYNELWTALDVIAERIRAIGGLVDLDALSAPDFQLSTDAMGMVKELAAGHRALAKKLGAMEARASGVEDPASADLFTERLRTHEQTAWMLEAMSE